VALRDGAPLLGLRRGVRASVLSAIAAGLLATVALTIMVTSGPSELVVSASALGSGAQPGRATQLHEWDAGRIEGLDNNLRRQEKLSDMKMEGSRAGEMSYIFGGQHAVKARTQGLSQMGGNWETLDTQQKRYTHMSETSQAFQQGSELSKIDSAIDANAAENHASVARRSYVSPYPKAYKSAKTQQLHEWDGGYIQGLPEGLERKEKLDDLHQSLQRQGEMSYIFSGKHAVKARTQGLKAAKMQQLHEWDGGYIQGLPEGLERKEKLDDLRQSRRRQGEMSYIFSGKHAVKARTQGLYMWGTGDQTDYRLNRKEQLGYLHEVGENSLDMKDIDGPLDQDMHKMQSARTVFKDKGPVQITQKLHQQIMAGYEAAKHDKGVRSVVKQQLTMLCDEGRSHPKYWALKTELDNLDGGEDDSDTIGSFEDSSLDDDSF